MIKIPSELTFPLFLELNVLILNSNQIFNIETLFQINFKQLTFLSLSKSYIKFIVDNKIKKLNCFRKWHHSSLKNIGLGYFLLI